MSQSNNIFKNENNRNKQSNLDSNFKNNVNWQNEAHKLRQRNRELIKKVVQLEQNIAESQEKFQSQVLRTRTGDTLLSQQQEELNVARGEIDYLNCHREQLEQKVQRQNILIETLSKQIETNQEQIAQLERECALIKEEYDRQNQKLSQTEKQAEELSDRLQRQQRYTLEFKAALDEFLEVPSPNHSLQQQLNGTSIVPKINAIQPWSATRKEAIPARAEIVPALEPEAETMAIKKVILPNLDNNKAPAKESEPTPPISQKIERPNSQKKSSRSPINLPKLPRYRSL